LLSFFSLSADCEDAVVDCAGLLQAVASFTVLLASAEDFDSVGEGVETGGTFKMADCFLFASIFCFNLRFRFSRNCVAATRITRVSNTGTPTHTYIYDAQNSSTAMVGSGLAELLATGATALCLPTSSPLFTSYTKSYLIITTSDGK
jgi:hypothetical protein